MATDPKPPRTDRPWLFKKGNSGNPLGRPKGIQSQKTIDAKEYASAMVDDPAYREALHKRLMAGTAGPMEGLLWHYAKGKPIDRVETGGPGAFADLSTDELRQRLAEALAKL